MCCAQVDSGDWGRGRVAELTAAGELMRAERDALLKLVQALRWEYEAVQLAKESQHDELRALKDKMTVKVSARVVWLRSAHPAMGTSVTRP